MRQGRFKESLISVLFSALLLFLPFLIQMTVAGQVSETIVRVEPQMNSANVNETFTINITVSNVENLYGIELTLNWNASVLEVMNLDIRLGETDGVLHNSLYIADNTTQIGVYILAATSLSPAPPFNGSGNVIIVNFNVTGYGNSKLDLETELWDYPPPDRDPRISLLIDHSTVDGVFNIAVPEFSSIIILTIFMILTIFVAIISKTIKTADPRTSS